MAFTCCCLLTWWLIWLRSELVNPCFIHCLIFTQKLLFVAMKQLQKSIESSTHCCFWSTVSKRGTYFEHSFLIDKCSSKMVNTLPSTPLLSHATAIYDQPKRLCEVFWCFPGELLNLTWAFNIICLSTTMFKVSIPPLNWFVRRSSVWIILIKPLLCLNSIFPIKKQCFINTRNSDFSIVLKICNSK